MDKPIYGSDESDTNTDADSAGNAGDSTDNSTEGTDNTVLRKPRQHPIRSLV